MSRSSRDFWREKGLALLEARKSEIIKKKGKEVETLKEKGKKQFLVSIGIYKEVQTKEKLKNQIRDLDKSIDKAVKEAGFSEWYLDRKIRELEEEATNGLPELAALNRQKEQFLELSHSSCKAAEIQKAYEELKKEDGPLAEQDFLDELRNMQ